MVHLFKDQLGLPHSMAATGWCRTFHTEARASGDRSGRCRSQSLRPEPRHWLPVTPTIPVGQSSPRATQTQGRVKLAKSWPTLNMLIKIIGNSVGACSSLFLLSCALEPCWGRLLSQLRLQSVGPLPRSQCGRRKVMGRRGPPQRAPACAHQVLWLVPGCSFRLLLCTSASPSSKPDAFKGSLQE